MSERSTAEVMASAQVIERALRGLEGAAKELEDLARFPIDPARGPVYAAQAAALRAILPLDVLQPSDLRELARLRDTWAMEACRGRPRAAPWARAADDLLRELPKGEQQWVNALFRVIQILQNAQPQAQALGLLEVSARLLPDLGIGITLNNAQLAEDVAQGLRDRSGSRGFAWLGESAMGELDDVTIGIYARPAGVSHGG